MLHVALIFWALQGFYLSDVDNYDGHFWGFDDDDYDGVCRM